ncbi:sce7726 family protein [Pectobacterium versatile]|uniref:sce7726 family protein n=1 Tax=Pectobacterium versatile TaxID=2488639 RepID=UPI0019695A5B|nr:sce7726 family protein [Pectobacterium versatile]MBN3239835.1 sce7726 family protein [Pectobacterium versatile]
MKEIEIKKILIEFLIKDELNIISSEFRFNFGARRADVICLKNDNLIAYEIKGSGDNTMKLKEQIDNYKKYFDQCYIVCEKSNLTLIRRETPSSIGILVVDNDDIKFIRKGRRIKRHDKVSLASTIDIKTLRKEISNKKIKSKHELCEILASQKSLSYIKKISRGDLLMKISLSHNIFISELGTRIHSDDILILSRMSSSALL